MNRRWLHLFFGQVQIEVTGRRAESFINRCLEHGVSISDITRKDEETIVCKVQSQDIRSLRALLRQSDCKFHIIRRRGLLFFIARLSFKKGFAAGLILFAAVLFVLSNMLWHIDIQGADSHTTREIEQVLHKMGVEPGKFQFSLPDKEEIQYAIADQVDQVAWIGSNLNGTTYHFNVLEKEIPKNERSLSPRNLVATKEAVIYNVYVEQGKAMVQPDEHVQKGDVLISGRIGDEKHQKVIPAKGKVLGETWYESKVTVPLVTELKTRTGTTYSKYGLSVFGYHIPIWGFAGPDFKKYDVETNSTPIKFLRWTLPISYETKTYMQTNKVQRKYTEKQAIAAAKRLAKNDLREKLDHNDKIKSEKILRESVKNGKVKIFMYYTVIEDIAKAQPLIQGD